MPHVRREVELMLAQTNEHLADAERMLASGDYRDKVDAAGDLALLRRHKQMIEERLKSIVQNESMPEDFFAIVREEYFNLTLRLRQFLTGGVHHI